MFQEKLWERKETELTGTWMLFNRAVPKQNHKTILQTKEQELGGQAGGSIPNSGMFQHILPSWFVMRHRVDW